MGEQERYVTPGETVTMAVSAHFDLGEVHYQWYESVEVVDEESGNSWEEFLPIEGAVSSSFVSAPVYALMQYFCRVSDDYGNNQDVWFTLHIDNHLTVQPVGTSDRTVAYQSSVTMQVTVDAGNMDNIRYRWYSEDDPDTTLSETDSLTISSVEQTANYYCMVIDDYGNSDGVWFYVYVDNQLIVQPVGPTDRAVAYGSSTTLQVTVSAANMNGLSYEWRDSQSNDCGSDTDTLVIDPVTHFSRYYCYVFDAFGNSASIGFSVYPDNDLSVEPVGNTTRHIIPGTDVSLEVTITARQYDGMTIAWHDADDWDEVFSETKTCTLPSMDRSRRLVCIVTDMYGTTKGISFEIIADNGLTAQRITPFHVTKKEGQPLTLEVSVNAIDKSQLSYCWKDGRGLEIENAGLESCTIESEEQLGTVTYDVWDQYGNIQTLEFDASVDNELLIRPVSATTVLVGPGESAVLEAFASARDEEGMTTRWYRLDTQNGMREFVGNGTRYTVPAVNYRGAYVFEVVDKFNHTAVLTFNVGVENHLRVVDSLTGEDYRRVLAPLNSRVELTVSVSADELDGLTYFWRYSGEESYTEASYVIPSLTHSISHQSCLVTDKYGNMASVNYSVNVENHLSVVINGGVEKIYVQPGETATLTAVIGADDETNLEYRWYAAPVNGSSYDIDREWRSDETGKTITTEPITQAICYFITVHDVYDTLLSDNIVVGVENQFSAHARNYRNEVIVDRGETATLEVEATAQDMTGMHYAWYIENGVVLSNLGVDGPSLTTAAVTGAQEYQCQVTDRYGNMETVWFRVGPENHLEIHPADFLWTHFAPLGGETTFEVIASADDDEGLRYQWYKMELLPGYTDRYSSSILPGETGTSLHVSDLQAAQLYRCEVTDKYGNRASVSLTAGVENHLIAEIDNQGTRNALFLADYVGGSVTLSAKASADDAEGLRYQWYRSAADETGNIRSFEAIPGATGTSYLAQNIQELTTFRFTVTDKYGNVASVWPLASIQNHLTVSSDLAEPDENGLYTIFGVPGSSLTLRATVEADNTDGLQYYWQDNASGPDGEILGQDSSLPIQIGTEARAYDFTVVDCYGTSFRIGFLVIPAYTLHYNANGGSGAPADQPLPCQGGLLLPEEIPVRSGYRFLGWASAADARTAEAQAGEFWGSGATGDATLYAVWGYAAPVLTAVGRTAEGVTLSWTGTSGAPRYNIYHKVGTGSWAWLAASTALSYTDTKVSSGTEYSYRLAIVTADGKSSLSPVSNEKSITFVTPPVFTLSNTAGGVQLSWTAVSGAPRYNIYRKTGTGSWAWLAASTGTGYLDATASAGVTYTYRMAVVTADGKSSLSAMSAEKSITFGMPPVFTVANTAAGVTLSWTAIENAPRYNIYRKVGTCSAP